MPQTVDGPTKISETNNVLRVNLTLGPCQEVCITLGVCVAGGLLDTSWWRSLLQELQAAAAQFSW